MSKTVADIAVRVGADVTPLTGGMKRAGRSMDNLDSKAKRAARRQEELARSMRAVAAAAAAAGAAIGAAAQFTFNYAKDIQNFSRVAGVGVERFQSLTFAASEFGIEQEKLADILKDVNDKIGDYVSTGAGPLVDFFDQIAPKVGVTVQQFQRLNSADALALYVETLEKANVSQAEMTFHMEALASDATMLAPLLSNNAAELKRLEGRARDLGAVIGSDVVSQTSRMGQVWGQIVAGMKAQFVNMASTVLTWFDDMMGITGQGKFNKMAAELNDQTRTLELYEDQLKRIESREEGMTFGGSNDKLSQDLRVKIADQKALISITNLGLDALERAEEERRRIMDKFNNAETDGFSTDAGGTAAGSAAEKLGLTEADLKSLRESIMTEREILLERQAQRMEDLRTAKEQELITEQEFYKLSEAAKKKHNEAMDNLDQKERDARISGLKSVFGDMAELMNVRNKKLFEIGKAAAIANATITGYEAATKAWNWGMGHGGPVVAAAVTAASLAKTGAQISSIASTSYGGGGGQSNAGGDGGASQAQAAQQQQPLTTYNINLRSVDGRVAEQDARDAFEKIAEGSRNGGVIVNYQ